MDLHDKKQPYNEYDNLEEELLEKETDDILDDEEYQEDAEAVSYTHLDVYKRQD